MTYGQIFNAMLDFFQSDDWNFNSLEDLPVLSMPFVGKSGRWMCYAQAREQQEQFVFYSVCPVNAPEERRMAATEYITRANYGMIIGNFEMDLDDGEIRYKTSIAVEGEALTQGLTKHLVYANVLIMDRYLPGLLRVIYGDGDPKDEISRIEGDDDAGTEPLHREIIEHIEDLLSELDDRPDEDIDDDDTNAEDTSDDHDEPEAH